MPRARPACSSDQFPGARRPGCFTAPHHNDKRLRRKQLNHRESKQWQKNVNRVAAIVIAGPARKSMTA